MIFRKKPKIETKRYPYRNNASSNYSAWDGLSIIEKFALITLPIMITFVDYMILEAMFGFKAWFTAAIATGSTVLLIVLISYMASLIEGD